MTEETLFEQALAKPAAERAAFLDEACAGQPELRAAVAALLAAHEAPESLLDKPPQELDRTVDSDQGDPGRGAMGEFTPEPDQGPRLTGDYRPGVAAGAVIAGHYTLVQKIGEGGMGEVWVAKQSEPVKRKVALKLIKIGMDSKAVLARFEQERQALALMDHPNIARVLDGGMTPTGQPFFVMELVNGLPLNKFCDEARLTPRERLVLFVPICQAVQHAHQKGIVHRDLKPANILITLIDGKPVPKVIDFGVAKATGGKLTDESMSTQFGAVVGTLEYMSPEQAGWSGADVDTRADIYSLGVILYEMLTGLRPLDAKRLKAAAYTEMIRIIQEEEPSKPSTRLSTEESLPSLAALRQTEPKKLMALLRGELDWVVMKCLEKQRDRRYETANGLARDVQRYLADEVVEARPPSAGYRLKKFVRRHKGQVAAVTVVLLALLLGMVGTTLGLLRAEQQRQIAESAEQDADARRIEAEKQKDRAEKGEKLASERLVQVNAEKEKAERENRIAKAVRAFLQEKLLGQADVIKQANALLQAGGLASQAQENPTIRELLDRAAAELSEGKIEKNFPGEPLLQAEILATVGNTYSGIGEFERAIAFLLRARDLYLAKLGPEHLSTLISMNGLARAYLQADKLELALPLCEQMLELTKANLGSEHRSTVISMNNLALAYQAAGKLKVALPLSEQTLKLTKAKLGPDHPDTLTLMNNLALAYQAAGKLKVALPLFEQTVKLTKAKLGPDHPSTFLSMRNLGLAYGDAGKLELALPLLEQTLELMKAKLGPEHPSTLFTMNSLVSLYQAAGKQGRPLPLFEETLKLRTEILGVDQRDRQVDWNDPKQVETVLLAVYAELKTGQQKSAVPPRLTLIPVVYRLVALYQTTGNKEEAARWKAELKRHQAEERARVIKATAARAKTDVSSTIVNPNKQYGLAANYRLVGNTTFGWQAKQLYGDVDVNGHDLTMDTGGGNQTIFFGVISGQGDFTWNGGGEGQFQTTASFLAGDRSNPFSGTLTILRGTLAFFKPDGVCAFAGKRLVLGGGSNQAILQLWASEQIDDGCMVVLTGKHEARIWTQGYSETVGPLEVRAMGYIDLGEGNSRVAFADSSQCKWDLSKTLTIQNWTADKDSICFGNNPSALTAAQLGRIRFENPSGLPAGSYSAKILEDGRLVPDRLVQPDETKQPAKK